MKIFSSKTNYIEFFIKIWKKCPTDCTNCSYAKSKLDYFSLDNIFERIDYWKNLFYSKDFVYFLYGVDFLCHPKAFDILEYVNKTSRKFKIQIWLDNLHNKQNILEEIYKKYWFFEITLANEVNDNEDVKNVFKAISVFSKMKYLRFNVDLIIDIDSNKILVDKLKWLFWNYFIDKVHKNLSFDDVWNINLWITNKFYFKPKSKEVLWVLYDNCVMDDLFDIKDDVIYFNDHLELDYDWNFMLHTPLCFLAYIKIAHKNDSEEKILNKFKKFKKDVSKISSNMSNKCYSCIINNYPWV